MISRGYSGSLPGAPRGRCTDPLSSSGPNADTGGLMSAPFIAPVGQMWVRFGLIRFYPKTNIASVLFFHPKLILSLLSPSGVYLFCSLLSSNCLEQERHPKSQVLMILVSLTAVEQRYFTFMGFLGSPSFWKSATSPGIFSMLVHLDPNVKEGISKTLLFDSKENSKSNSSRASLKFTCNLF